MNQPVVMTIFAFLSGTTVINFLAAIGARIKTQHRPYGRLILYWVSITVTYVAAFLIHEGMAKIGLVYFFLCVSFGIATLLPLLMMQQWEKRVREAQQRESSAALEEKSNLNEILVKAMAHDLANPLTIIAGYAHFIEKGETGPYDPCELAARIGRTTQNAMDLITRVREAMRVTPAGKCMAGRDLCETLRKLEDAFYPRLEAKQLRMRFTGGLDEGVRVKGDRDMLMEHVLANAASNAIKFSHSGSEILINVCRQGDIVRITLSDQGIGLGEKGLSAYQPTQRLGTAGEPGNGMGVLLMRFFVTRMGGSLALRSPSQLGGSERPGTDVVIDLPAESACVI